MWKKLIAWHHRLEDEGPMVLENPALAHSLPPGLRRNMALKLADMPPFERQQLRAFSLKYYGWRAYAALGKLILFCSASAWLLHLALGRGSAAGMIVLANAVGLGMLAMFIGAWYNHSALMKNKAKVSLGLLTIAVLGNIAGAGMAAHNQGRTMMSVLESLPALIMYTALGMSVFVLLPLGIVVALRNQHYHVWTGQLQLEAERERAARELSEASLRMLRAQIEPHFLFNTLGAVQQLAERGAPRAAELTANLIAFLRASLSEMRSDNVTLRGDFGLIEAYLDVMKARLGERLAYTLSLPEPLAEVSVPSMMLLTLVENAIKHGIEPALGGGAITVAAERLAGQVRIRVQDSGVGMHAIPGQGHGLENVRARLKLGYGGAASLNLAEGEPNGMIADIVFPAEQQKA